MLTYIEESLFVSPAQVLVNTVNTAGVMGKGIAKVFKGLCPEMFAEYKEYCDRGELTIGKLLLYRTPYKWVLNFPTKRHWRAPSRLTDIERGLQTFERTYESLGISNIAFPQLGCGNGQLDWESQVRPLMESYLVDLPIEVFIHIQSGSGLDTADEPQSKHPIWADAGSVSPRREQVWTDLVATVRCRSDDAWGVVVDDIERPTGLRHQSGLILAEAELFDLWHQLRTFGYVSLLDVAVGPSYYAEALFDLLEQLDYVEPARFAVQFDRSPGNGSATVVKLLDAAPRGLRYAPVTDQQMAASPTAALTLGAEPWSESPTKEQLQLLLTS